MVPDGHVYVDPVESKFISITKKLLDLSKKNPLLFFKADRGVVLDVDSNEIHSLISLLVDEGVTCEIAFGGKEKTASSGSRTAKVTVHRVYIKGDERAAQRTLNSLIRTARFREREMGVWTLYLSVGLLEWKDIAFNTDVLSPVILVPVRITYDRAERKYLLSAADEDTVVNPALLQRLEEVMGREFRTLERDAGSKEIKDYLEDMEQHLAEGMRLHYRLNFSILFFQKLVMYADLQRSRKKFLENPIVRAVCGDSISPDKGIPEEILTREVRDLPKNAFPILDADSSQLEAIIRAVHGESLVIQGPPGTGKSQTIVNLIAFALREGKTILFVSEKMAALDVVYKRLSAAGLSSACLELHSHSSDKKEVLRDIERTLHRHMDEEHELETSFRKLAAKREQLDAYVEALRKQMGAMQGANYYTAVCELTRLRNIPLLKFELPEDPMKVDYDRFDKWKKSILKFSDARSKCFSETINPWHNIEFDPSKFSSDLSLTIAEDVGKLHAALTSLSQLCTGEQYLSLLSIKTLESFDAYSEVLHEVPSLSGIPEKWFSLRREQLAAMLSHVSKLKKLSAEHATLRAMLESEVEPSISEMDTMQVIKRFELIHASKLRFARQAYRSDAVLVRSHLKDKRAGYNAMLDVLRREQRRREIAAEFSSLHDGKELLTEGGFDGIEADWARCEMLLSTLLRLYIGRDESVVYSVLVNLPQYLPSLPALLKGMDALRSTVSEPLLRLQPSFKDSIASMQFQEIIGDLAKKLSDVSLTMLRQWNEYLMAARECENLLLSGFLRKCIDSNLQPADYWPAFEKRFWTIWTEDAVKSVDALRTFTIEDHERVIEEFRKLDKELMKVTARLIAEEANSRIPSAVNDGITSSEMNVLLKETAKKRRHMPIRELFHQTQHIIQHIKPCIMMSPLSISTYLPPDMNFDIIIFDEASQVRVEEAMGAMGRGRQLIVVGDTRQLPPTSFFDTMSNPEEYDDYVEDTLESVLDECSTLPVFRIVRLKWHYRSRYEGLIAFSNREFYDGALITFPSPSDAAGICPIELKCLENAMYERGGRRINEEECEEVIRLVREHAANQPDESLGVVTVNMAQQDAIQERIEKLLAGNKEFSAFASNHEDNEPFFVKSIENVQGDERDRIIISLTYGKDEEGVLHLNFGPLNRDGGERRLNVAVTRARKHVTVISSFKAEELPDTGISRGVMTLKNYLKYAEACAEGGHGNSASYQVDAIGEEILSLIKMGDMETATGVGVSRPLIDVAVFNKEQGKGTAILLDGRQYGGFMNARDRDRLLPMMLEGLGWKVSVVWSSGWLANSDSIMRRIGSMTETGIVMDREGGSGKTKGKIQTERRNSASKRKSTANPAPASKRKRMKDGKSGEDGISGEHKA
ncbi:MAG: DUF4011 domain-containing protein [Methanomassiliicoccales archaeon]